MKLIGALLILAASSWIGLEVSRSYSERIRQLRMMKSALQSLEAEIMYGHTPLHEASRKISKQFVVPIQILFDCFSNKLIEREITAKQAWEESLKEIWPKTAMKNSELEILLQFGETLGRHDLVQQQKQIQLTLTYLERVEREATEKQQTYGKMVKSLGVLSGLFIIIILI
ncbi:stage III sporulation protein SpoIIIAB [Fervidibacillus halotolerans]|uniref:Stage III sporulation protein SpoIIIAB n=1 Tax=Fervidibacillus halotolerans TaxID=2980027 RepID=A0A9E8RXP1_9BACI|nr:stage III sporulation protein SpoIIIAB [Fervidibacillus halotolerans]WAA11429.1 stage III sporulation protein SpoIIIAB [Fervidibacillus halotolerans]